MNQSFAVTAIISPCPLPSNKALREHTQSNKDFPNRRQANIIFPMHLIACKSGCHRYEYIDDAWH